MCKFQLEYLVNHCEYNLEIRFALEITAFASAILYSKSHGDHSLSPPSELHTHVFAQDCNYHTYMCSVRMLLGYAPHLYLLLSPLSLMHNWAKPTNDFSIYK